MPKNNSSQSGISLIEIVITMMVIGFVVLIIANIPQSIRLISGSNKESIAKDIIGKKIEDLRAQGYGVLSNGTTQITNPPESRLNSLPAYNTAVIISDCPISICTGSEHTKKVEVKISWSDQGKINNVDVVTLISEGGLQ